MTLFSAKIRLRIDTEANWIATNPVLEVGEAAVFSDKDNRLKIGDGATSINSLPFHSFRFDGSKMIVDEGNIITNSDGSIVVDFGTLSNKYWQVGDADENTYVFVHPGNERIELGNPVGVIQVTTGSINSSHNSLITLNAPAVEVNGDAIETKGSKGIAGGYAELDGTGKVPTSQLPSSVVGQVHYMGQWNPSTNSPALASSTGSKGDYYVCSTAGSTNLDGIADWKLGDWAIFNGTTWDKIDNTDALISFNGRTGAVVPASGDYTTDQVTEGSNQYFTAARVRATSLTGVDNTLTGTPSATDTVLQAWGRAINFITNIATTVRGTVLAGLSTATNAVITASDSVISALGKLQAQITAKGVYCDSISADFTTLNNTLEQTIATFTVAAGVTGINSEYEVLAEFDMTGNPNTKTLRIYHDGNLVRTFAVTNSSAGAAIQALFANKGSLISQITNGTPSNSSANSFGALGATTTYSVNTANAHTVTITAQKSTASDTIIHRRAMLTIKNNR